MEYKVGRDETPIEFKRMVISIGNIDYRITESVDGKLNINKSGDENGLRVYPRYANEIEVK